MNINPEYSSNDELNANDIMAKGMHLISEILIDPAMQSGKLDEEDQSLLGLVGVSFKIIAEKATAYEMMEEAEQEEQLNQDKTIGFYRN
tara:strand:- start:974 stop:1240 length:267 start_codon:yes stop_codon:yes gene_type:complete